jgi:hypothetical protein
VIVKRLRFVVRLLEGEAMSDALPAKGAFFGEIHSRTGRH